MDLLSVLGPLGGIGAAFGLSSSAGLNAYIPLLVVALAARFPAPEPLLQLQAPYDALSSWWAIGALVVLLLIEVFVDKVPAVDTINDVIQTAVRPTAGAILFAANASVITDVSPVLAIVAGILVAGGVHVTKSVARPAVTATTAGTGNWIVSIAEDVLAFFVSLLSVIVPVLALMAMAAFIVFLITLWLRRRRQPDKLAF